MAIKNIIAGGIGFSPGSVKFIPTLGFIASTVVWVTMGSPWLFTSSNWESGVTYAYEVVMRASSGTALGRLYNNTAAAAVSSSEVLTTSATLVRVRSSTVTLVDGNEYAAQFGSDSSSTGKARGAKMIIK